MVSPLPTDRPSSRRVPLRIAAGLALLVLIAYAPAFRGDFVWDDRPLIVDNPLVQDPGAAGRLIGQGFWETGDRHDRFRDFYRPLVSLSYAADHLLWGLQPAGFHATNVLLHLLCTLLVWRLARREGVGEGAAGVGAALFALHPVHVESVAWISGRTDLLCGAAMLGSFLLHRRAGECASFTAARVGSWGLYAAALASKEMAATLPALVALDVAWSGSGGVRPRLRRVLAVTAPYAALLALYLVARGAVLGSGGESLYRLGFESYAATALFVAGRYVTLLLLPLGLDAHYPYAPLERLIAPLPLVAAALLVVSAWAALRIARVERRAAFWILWIAVTLIPVFAIGRFGDVLLADRFLYVPSAGLALGAAFGWRLWADSRERGRRAVRALRVAVAIVLVLLGALSFRRSAVWRDDLTLFTDMLRTSSGSALVRNNLGLAHYHRGEVERALAEFRAAVELTPDFALARSNLAAALDRQGHEEQALRHYLKALEDAPGLLEAATNAGHLLVRSGRVDRGLALLRVAVRDHPRSGQARFALAAALDEAGRPTEALPLVREALDLAPGHAQAHYLLGKLLAEAGEPAAAAEAMRRFLDLWPDDDRYAREARRVVAGERL